MKMIQKMLCVLLVAVMTISLIPAVPAEAAASKTSAPAYNGQWTYYAIYNTIYKLDSKNGTAQKMKEIKDVDMITDISYYDGYLYFAANYYCGTDGSDYYVCRIKTNGTSFQKLGRGCEPVIYNKKIYYLKTKHIKDEYNEYDEILSVSEMSLTGKNNRELVKRGNSEYFMWNLGVANGKVYYTKNAASSGTAYAMSCDIKSKKSQKLFTKQTMIELVDEDASYLYYNIDYNTVGVYDIKKGKLSAKKYNDSVSVLGGKNGTAYFSRYSTYSTYAYHASENKVATVIKNKYLSNMTFSQSGYHMFQYVMTQEEFEASGYQYDMAAACMKLDGKGFKILKKYYVP